MSSLSPLSRQAVNRRFGKNLRRLREDRGLSQEALADLSGIHRTEAGLLERGKREPRMGTLVKLAGALEVSIEELVKGIEWQPSEKRFSKGTYKTRRT